MRLGRKSGAGTPVEAKRLAPAFWALAAIAALVAAWVVWDEAVTRRPYKEFQAEYRALLARRGEPAPRDGIHQITIPALGIADRCLTCHQGADRSGLEGDDLPPVLRTHPRREELLGKRHPVERVGCTSCHDGQGLQTKGIAGARFDHGRDDPYWERPLRTGAFVEASCGECHAAERELPGAPVLARGRFLFERLRCNGCHVASRVTGPAPGRAPAPPLDRLRLKTSRGAVAAWLRDPRAVRADARMGAFWPAPVEPADGTPSPPGGERHQRWRAERDAEVTAIVAYLGAMSVDAFPEGADARAPSAPGGLVEEGKALFDAVGCRGCHTLGDDGSAPRDERFGPALDGIGGRVSSAWLAAWLSAPKRLAPGTRMPDLRLEPGQRDRLVAFLASLRRPEDPIATTSWDEASPEVVAAGRKAVLAYGCGGCHVVPGLDLTAPIGPELDGYGDVTSDRLDWGEAQVRCELPEVQCWTLEKLAAPRRLAARGSQLVMPRFELSPEDRTALAVLLLGQRARPGERALDDRARAIAEGERVIARLNCRGCHEIGRDEERFFEEDGTLLDVVYRPRGGEIRRLYSEVALAPPPLTFAGEKFQPAWLFEFLRNPQRLRPWLSVRMPRFDLEPADANALVRYFAASNGQAGPFTPLDVPALSPQEVADGNRLFTRLQCLKCHGLSVRRDVKTGERAPDLALSPVRLKPGWIADFILDPQRLQPGTRMPTYFPLSDDDDPSSRITPFPSALGGDIRRQIDALVHVNMRREGASPRSPEGGHR